MSRLVVSGWESYGLSLFKLKKYAAAVDALESATLFRPISDSTRIALAVAYGRIGKLQLSKDLLLNLGTSGRLNANLLLRVAAGLNDLGLPRLAMEACRRAWRLSPELAQIHFDMGRYSIHAKFPAHLCQSLLEQAVTLEPANVLFRIGLMSFLCSQGKLAAAVTCIKACSPEGISKIACCHCLQRVIQLLVACHEYELASEWTSYLQ